MSESNKRSHASTKRNTVAVVAIILACILAIGGTIAYLTSRSTLTNTFTVGQISPVDPTKPGPDPDGNGPDPGITIEPEEDKNNGKLNGNLYEPNWVKDSKLLPSATIAKDPYVGVGPGSEASAVFVNVDNTMKNRENNKVYFKINDGWTPVYGCTTSIQVQGQTYYAKGLFKYDAGLDASAVKDKNVWTTTPLFSEVVISKDADSEDFTILDGTKVGDIVVESFLHQSKDAKNSPIAENTILEAVKKQFGYIQ